MSLSLGGGSTVSNRWDFFSCHGLPSALLLGDNVSLPAKFHFMADEKPRNAAESVEYQFCERHLVCIILKPLQKYIAVSFVSPFYI